MEISIRLSSWLIALTTALALASLAHAQPAPEWQQQAGDEVFSGNFGSIEVEDIELRVGCAADAQTLPLMTLSTEAPLGSDNRDVFVLVPGSESTTQQWSSFSGGLELTGFDAILLLTELTNAADARAVFLRVEGDGGGSWTIPLAGLHDVLDVLPCTSAF